MRNQIIQMINNALAGRTSYFTREQEIQIFLANLFESSEAFDRVFLEHHIPAGLIPAYPWTDANNIYVDIVLQKDGRYYPIEIKFKTKHQIVPIEFFGNNHQVSLGQHGAKNLGCYDFWKDIKRLELYEESFPNVEQGIMLFVTNDNSYLRQPLNMNTGYAQFSIHEQKRVHPNDTLDWNGDLAIAENRPVIQLSRGYQLLWEEMQLENHFYILF